MIRVPVLIPVNALSKAKGRLSEVLEADERRTLTLIALETVLHAAGDAAIVLTKDPDVERAAGGQARILPESAAARGLNGQLEFAMAALIADGTARERLLILHADLPLVTREALETLEAMGRPGAAVMVESRDGGTNAMLLQPPGRFALAYGKGSFAAHRAAAEAAGMTVIRNHNRELRLDLDTPDDIVELLRAPRGRQGAAGRYLLSIGIEDRMGARK